MPVLTLQLPGLPPVSHELKEETITIGRMRNNTIIIDDVSVSLSHARITFRDGVYHLKDLNSTNGTLLNGQSIREARLRDKDRVTFGEVSGHFEDGAPAAVAPKVEAPVTAGAKPAEISLNPAPQTKALSGSPRPAEERTSVAGTATVHDARKVEILAKDVPKPEPQHAAAQKPHAPLTLRTPQLGAVHPIAPELPPLPRKKARKPGLIAAIVAVVALIASAAVFGPKAYKKFQEKGNAAVKPEASAVVAAAPPKTPEPNQQSVSRPVPEPEKPIDPQLASLMAALKANDAGERRRAAQELHSLGEQAAPATPALREALSDTDEDVQIWCALTLINNRAYDPKTIPVCTRALHHTNSVLRQVACLSLALISYQQGEKETVLPALKEAAANDRDEEVRKAAKSALDIINAEVAGPPQK